MDSEGGYVVSCEMINTIRQIYEANSDPKSKNYIWHKTIDEALCSIFKDNNLSIFKRDHGVELETLMSLIRGCEYMGMVPYARASVINNKEAEIIEIDNKPEEKSKFVKIIGFVKKQWLANKSIDVSEEETRVYPSLKDTN